LPRTLSKKRSGFLRFREKELPSNDTHHLPRVSTSSQSISIYRDIVRRLAAAGEVPPAGNAGRKYSRSNFIPPRQAQWHQSLLQAYSTAHSKANPHPDPKLQKYSVKWVSIVYANSTLESGYAAVFPIGLQLSPTTNLFQGV
jgi:hypothetical protein